MVDWKSCLRIAWRGLKRKCPACGNGKLFKKWNELVPHCQECDIVIRAREDDTWFFMYMSTAAMTGIIIILMFLITPKSIRMGQWIVAIVAFGTFIVTTEPRKGLAIAMDYWIDSHSENPRHRQ